MNSKNNGWSNFDSLNSIFLIISLKGGFIKKIIILFQKKKILNLKLGTKFVKPWAEEAIIDGILKHIFSQNHVIILFENGYKVG